MLCHLDNDLSESSDLATKHPETAAHLASALEGWTKEIIDPVFLGSSVKNEDWGPGGANQKDDNVKRVKSK